MDEPKDIAIQEITVALGGGKFLTVTTLARAGEYLLKEWPGERDPKHIAAQVAILDALEATSLEVRRVSLSLRPSKRVAYLSSTSSGQHPPARSSTGTRASQDADGNRSAREPSSAFNICN